MDSTEQPELEPAHLRHSQKGQQHQSIPSEETSAVPKED